MDGNAREICVLILYPETLLNSLISSFSFMKVSLEFSTYGIVSCSASAKEPALPV